jgi:sugar/nucleoside kinase (ribokinase family)
VQIAGVQAKPGGDNVGCGDAYVAILVHGMTLGWDLETSGMAASRWAAAVAGERGATPRFSDEQIDELLAASVP